MDMNEIKRSKVVKKETICKMAHRIQGEEAGRHCEVIVTQEQVHTGILPKCDEDH